MLKNFLQTIVYKIISPLVSLLVRLGISPNLLTVMGFIWNLLACWFFIRAAQSLPGYSDLITAGVFILVGGFFDILDGRVARVTETSSRSGALFDSVVDRYAELAMFLGLGWYAHAAGEDRFLLGLFFALSGSLMVSYTRARIEGLQGKAPGGLFQRPERIVLISIATILTGLAGSAGQLHAEFYIQRFLEIPIWCIAVGALATAIYRLVYGYNELR